MTGGPRGFSLAPRRAPVAWPSAIEKAKSADKEAVRAAIEDLKNVVGIGGIFNFSAKDHNGLGIDSFEMLTVKNGKFAILEQKTEKKKK